MYSMPHNTVNELMKYLTQAMCQLVILNVYDCTIYLPTVQVDEFPPPGVCFHGDSLVVLIDHHHQQVHWEEHGITLTIPPDTIPEGKQAVLRAQYCLGPFVPPQGFKLASPVYHVTASHEFRKEVEVVVPHFADLQSEEDCRGMTFARAPSVPTYNQKGKPEYHFKPLKGGPGVFMQEDTNAVLQLKHCSLLGIFGWDNSSKAKKLLVFTLCIISTL